jgi:hypothetical protein
MRIHEDAALGWTARRTDALGSLQSGSFTDFEMTDQPAGGFLLVTMDPLGARGVRLPAIQLVRDRLAAARWPIFEGTRNRNAILVGSRVAFYVGGTKDYSGKIVAAAVVTRKSKMTGPLDLPRYATEWPAYALTLGEVVWLEPCIDFRSRLPELSFRPKNLDRWGVVLMGGCRALAPADWAALLRGTPPVAASSATSPRDPHRLA